MHLRGLKTVYPGTGRPQFLACDRASSDRLMAMDEGARCAMAWDTLLRRRFDGNVTALLAWWRAERERRRPTD
jgi:hypothetical protein